ncbi:MAG TPA: sulfotransferase domain-containing protein, partial [Acidimicrobiales bacterium]
MAESIDRSFYARSLRQWLHCFPGDRVLVLQYERCVQDPLSQLSSTYRFLGLDDAHRPLGVGPAHRAPTLPALDPRTEGRLIDLYAADVADLATLVPTLDLSLWPRFAGTT